MIDSRGVLSDPFYNDGQMFWRSCLDIDYSCLPERENPLPLPPIWESTPSTKRVGSNDAAPQRQNRDNGQGQGKGVDSGPAGLPAPNELISYLLNEEYTRQIPGSSTKDILRRLFFVLKPLIPRFSQIWIRRVVASKVMSRRIFPRWPTDTSVDQLHRIFLSQWMKSSECTSVPIISFWPHNAQFCFVITHDVEQFQGQKNILPIIAIEKKLGFRSAWFFVPERYPVDNMILSQLIAEGFEVGVHGLKHDGKLFNSRHLFEIRAGAINNYITSWHVSGFRSPSAIRRSSWISDEIRVDYDSSCPSSEYYGAQPGGCCTVFPFWINTMVELPITLQQDHTLLEILRLSPQAMVDNWMEAVEQIKQVQGMVLVDVHPDYLLGSDRLNAYQDFLEKIRSELSYWHALPKDTAQWWRNRLKSWIVEDESGWKVIGPASPEACVVIVTIQDDCLTFKKPNDW